MKRGDKFSVNASLDVEILGFYPAGEQQDGKAKYVCTINGYKMTAGADFLENLKAFEVKNVDADLTAKTETIIVKKKKEVKKSGRKRK